MTEEAGIAVSGIAITRRVVLTEKEDITFQVGVDSTTDDRDLNDVLDRLGRAATRQRAISELPLKEQALGVARAQPAAMDREIERLRTLRAQQVASFQAAHSVGNRRGEWKPNDQQTCNLREIDQQIANSQISRAKFMGDIPICEWEIARRIAIRDGLPSPPRPQELDDAMADVMLSQAAE